MVGPGVSRPPGTVRIVAGARRGRVLRGPPGAGVMGLESLSRGAERCVFVEQDRQVAELLRANISALDFEVAARIVIADYESALRALSRTAEAFDLLFVDPPYRMLP